MRWSLFAAAVGALKVLVYADDGLQERPPTVAWIAPCVTPPVFRLCKPWC